MSNVIEFPIRRAPRDRDLDKEIDKLNALLWARRQRRRLADVECPSASEHYTGNRPDGGPEAA